MNHEILKSALFYIALIGVVVLAICYCQSSAHGLDVWESFSQRREFNGLARVERDPQLTYLAERECQIAKYMGRGGHYYGSNKYANRAGVGYMWSKRGFYDPQGRYINACYSTLKAPRGYTLKVGAAAVPSKDRKTTFYAVMFSLKEIKK